MALKLSNDEGISPTSEVRRFTGTIPYEILLKIIEQCDVTTLIKCQKLNKATYQLFSLFSDQIVNSVASRQSYYKHNLFTRGRPQRLTIAYLKHIHMAHLFCHRICMQRFGSDVSKPGEWAKLSPERRETISTFMDQLHHGCRIALQLIAARGLGERRFAAEELGHRKTFNRQMTAHWRLERYIEVAQQAVLKNTLPREVLSFKLFWICRAVAITPAGRFTAENEQTQPLVRGRPGRSVQRKEVQDPQSQSWNAWTKHWAAGFLLDFGAPQALLAGVAIEGDPVEGSHGTFERLIGRMRMNYSRTGYKARIAHLERAHRVLNSMDLIVRRTLGQISAHHNGQSLTQQQNEHNRSVMRHLKEYLDHLKVPGRRSIPLMSSQPFAERIEPSAPP
jgi:hypothetical protein